MRRALGLALAALLTGCIVVADETRDPSEYQGPCTFDFQCDDGKKGTADSCIKNVCHHDPVTAPWGS